MSDPFPGGASSLRRVSDTHRGNLYSNKVRPEQRCAPTEVGGSHHGSHKRYPEVLQDKNESNWAGPVV